MPGLASILYTDGSFKQVAVAKAVAAHNALTGITEPTVEQAEWLCTIKRIFIPPSHRPANYQAVGTFNVDTSHMIHTGIQQGMTQALPVNDR